MTEQSDSNYNHKQASGSAQTMYKVTSAKRVIVEKNCFCQHGVVEAMILCALCGMN